MIPKLIHFIWVGDESKRPDNCIETWRTMNPDWDFLLWGNAELDGMEWVNHAHMRAMYGRELNGVADMMRWELLHAHGGIVVDADSIALRPLDEALLQCEAFACWENEIVRPGLIAAGYFGSVAGNPFLKHIIDDIAAEPSVIDEMAWQTVGPQRLTDSYRKYGYSRLRIYPSHYFIPRHFTGIAYDGPDPIYAHQLWGSTRGAYDEIHRHDFATDITNDPASDSAPQPQTLTPEPVAPQQDDPQAADHIQRVPVSNAIETLDRVAVLAQLCQGKRVLHVGCGDWSGDDPAASLHLALEPHCAALDGYDPRPEMVEALAPLSKGRLHARLEDITDRYDVVLAPAMMGHVPDVSAFLAQLQALDTSCYFVAVPDAFQARDRRLSYVEHDQTFVERVHPDHHGWYTPYTFSNAIRAHSDLTVEQMWFFNGDALLALLSKSDMLMAA